MPELNTLGLFHKGADGFRLLLLFYYIRRGPVYQRLFRRPDRAAPDGVRRAAGFEPVQSPAVFCARLRVLLFFGDERLCAVDGMVADPAPCGEYYDEKGKSKFGIDISTTVPLGTLASYGVSMLALKFLPWNGVFLVCGLIVLAVSLVWFFGTGWLLPKMERVAPPPAAQMARASGEKLPLRQFLSLFASSGLILLLIPIAVHGTLKDSVTQWVPTYIVETFAADSSISLLLTMILPIVNVAGAYLAKWLNRYTRSEPATASVFFALALGLFEPCSAGATGACFSRSCASRGLQPPCLRLM